MLAPTIGRHAAMPELEPDWARTVQQANRANEWARQVQRTQILIDNRPLSAPPRHVQPPPHPGTTETRARQVQQKKRSGDDKVNPSPKKDTKTGGYQHAQQWPPRVIVPPNGQPWAPHAQQRAPRVVPPPNRLNHEAMDSTVKSDPPRSFHPPPPTGPTTTTRTDSGAMETRPLHGQHKKRSDTDTHRSRSRARRAHRSWRAVRLHVQTQSSRSRARQTQSSSTIATGPNGEAFTPNSRWVKLQAEKRAKDLEEQAAPKQVYLTAASEVQVPTRGPQAVVPAWKKEAELRDQTAPSGSAPEEDPPSKKKRKSRRAVTQEERNTTMHNPGAIEPRKNGDASWRAKHGCAPPEKASRTRVVPPPIRSGTNTKMNHEAMGSTVESDQPRPFHPPPPTSTATTTRADPGAMETRAQHGQTKKPDTDKEDPTPKKKTRSRKEDVVMQEERNTTTHDSEAIELRKNGDASWRGKHGCAPSEKAPRKRSRSEPAASSDNSNQKQRTPIEAGGDVSHKDTRDASASAGEREEDRAPRHYGIASFQHLMEKTSGEFLDAIEKTNKKLYRDWNEQYYSEHEFLSYYYHHETGPMCYECSKYATTETISALRQMRSNPQSFSSLRSILESWSRGKQDWQKGKLIFDLFYVTLRCRAQYFWQKFGTLGVDAWTLPWDPNKRERDDVWTFVKCYMVSARQGSSQIPRLIQNCAPNTKTTNLVKIIVEKGVSDDGDWKRAIIRCEHNVL